MEIESQFITEELPPHTEETYEESSAQVHPLQLRHPLQEGHPSQEGPSSQEGPPAWFIEYFGKLNGTMKRIEQC